MTRRQMNAWAASFENWAVCDTVCFHLFDRTPFAWEKARQWAASPREFVKRGGFALMACLALHDKAAPDAQFPGLPAPHREGRARRTQLREEGRELGPSLHRQAQPRAQRGRPGDGQASGASEEAACRWVGKDARREWQAESAFAARATS